MVGRRLNSDRIQNSLLRTKNPQLSLNELKAIEEFGKKLADKVLQKKELFLVQL